MTKHHFAYILFALISLMNMSVKNTNAATPCENAGAGFSCHNFTGNITCETMSQIGIANQVTRKDLSCGVGTCCMIANTTSPSVTTPATPITNTTPASTPNSTITPNTTPTTNATSDSGSIQNNTNTGSSNQIAATKISGSAGSNGLITCGRTGQNMCTLCDLIKGMNIIIQYLMRLSIGVALLAMAIGGIMYVVSAGDTGLIDKAKGAMKNAGVGFTIIFTGWLIINTVITYIGTRSDMGIGVTSWGQFNCNANLGTSSENTATTLSADAIPSKECESKKLKSIDVQCENGPTDSISLASTATSDKPSTYNLKAMATYDCTDTNGTTSEKQEDVTQVATWEATDETIAKADKGIIRATGSGNTPISVSIEDQSTSIDIFVDSCPLNSGGDDGNENSQTSFLQKDGSLAEKFKAFIGENALAITWQQTLKNNSCTVCHNNYPVNKPKCEFVAGSSNAKFVFIIGRTDLGWAGHACKSIKLWEDDDKLGDAAKKGFADTVTKIASGLGKFGDISGDMKNTWAVYRSDRIYKQDETASADAIGQECESSISNLKGKLILPAFVEDSDTILGGREYTSFSGRGAIYCDSSFGLDLVAIHEQIGHQFAHLSDEYFDLPGLTSDASERAGLSEVSKNCTVNPTCAKWKNITSGCYQGCMYMSKGVYRSSFGSMMFNHMGIIGSLTLGAVSFQDFSDLQKAIIYARFKYFPQEATDLDETITFK